MSNPHASQVGRRAGRTAYIIGAALVVVALVLCGGGGVWFGGPATRAGQGTERAVIGMAIFDMHEGDDYWLYQPGGESWPDEMDCRFGAPSDENFVMRRSERPFGAPETATHSGEEYTFYAALRGDRNEEVLIECPVSDRYLVVPSRVPVWSLLAALGGGVAIGLIGLLVVVIAAVRHRPGAAARRAGAMAAASPVMAAPSPTMAALGLPPPLVTGAPAPGPGGAAPRARPSPLWYLVVLPFTAIAVLACMIGGLGGLGAGFTDSFEPPTIGQPRSGTVYDAYRYDDQYLLYADQAEDPPAEPVTCLIEDDFDGVRPLPVGTDRPFGVPETITHEDQQFRFVGTFSLSDPVLGTVACEGESTLLTKPSNRPQLMVVTGLAVALGALIVAAAFGIVLSAKRRR